MAIDLLTVPNILDFNLELKLQGFKVYTIDTKRNVVRSYNRKDFYKICIITGHNIIQYAEKGFEVNGTTLFFGNPLILYSWENMNQQTGYTCLFSESFLKGHDRSESLQESPLFKVGGIQFFPPMSSNGNLLSNTSKECLSSRIPIINIGMISFATILI